MSNKFKMLVCALPLLLCGVAASASASEYDNPDGNGGCLAANYTNIDPYGWSGSFSIPAMANSTSAGAWGSTWDDYGHSQQVQILFSCTDGVISGSYGYEYGDSYSYY